MRARSPDVLNRTTMVPMHPNHLAAETDAIVHNIDVASRVAWGGLSLGDAEVRPTGGIDPETFDMPTVRARSRSGIEPLVSPMPVGQRQEKESSATSSQSSIGGGTGCGPAPTTD